MPDEGATGWDDAIRGRIEFPNEQLDDLVIVRSDGRPTYNFASPVEDWLDGITHVIRGDDHVSNTPKQIRILEGARRRAARLRARREHQRRGRARSSPSGTAPSRSTSSATAGYLPDALFNFLALLGWAPDGETTIMSRDEIVERFTLERVGASPATFDYHKLDWLNGVYLRALSPEAYADALVEWLREQGATGTRSASARRRRSCRRRSRGSASSRASRGSSSARSSPTAELLDGGGAVLAEAETGARGGRAVPAERSRRAEGRSASGWTLKPRQAFAPIRVAVTGSKVSPGLYESLELLGRDETLARLRPRSAQRPRPRQRVERPLEREPGAAPVAAVGVGRTGSPAGGP